MTALMEAMMTTFGEAFDEVDIYTEARPSADYLERLLDSNHFIALTALKGGAVVGGLAAYELQSSSGSAARSTSTIWPWPPRTGVKASQRR